MFESQVREYILDAFLKDVLPTRAKIWSEVPSKSISGERGILDYLIPFADDWFAVEAKCVYVDCLELRLQLAKYSSASALLAGEWIKVNRKVLVMDRSGVWVYTLDGVSHAGELTKLASFVDLSVMPNDAITDLIFKAVK